MSEKLYKQDEIEKYERGWTTKMVEIWREKIDRLRVVDTGTLYGSISGLMHPGEPTTIEFQFMAYGKYVSEGVGRNFKRSKIAGGKIPFLLPGGEDYRREHRLDRPRRIGPGWHRSKNSQGDASNHEAGGRPMKYNPVTGYYTTRDWFYAKYYGSRMALNETLADHYGMAYKGMMTMLLDEVTKKLRFTY